MWAIRNVNNSDLYWSNDWGWGIFKGCDLYAVPNANLPNRGEWYYTGQ